VNEAHAVRFPSAGPGESEETLAAGAGLEFGGGGGGLHSEFTENGQEKEVTLLTPRRDGEMGKRLSRPSLFTLSRLSSRGRLGSQGSEAYSPYDFSEQQEVPESKHPFY